MKRMFKWTRMGSNSQGKQFTTFMDGPQHGSGNTTLCIDLLGRHGAAAAAAAA